MHSAGFLHNMPKNKTKQSNEEQTVSDRLKKLDELLQEAQDNAVYLETEFHKYTQEVHSQTCAKKVKGCEPDKTDQNSVTDAQSSTQGWVSWVLSWIIPKGSEIQKQSSLQKIQSSLKKNKELIVCCQEKLKDLSQENLVKSHADLEKQNQDLPKKHSESKGMRGLKWFLVLNPMNLLPTQPEKQNVTYQLYCQQQADLIQSIMTELAEKLRSDCSRYGIELKEKILELATDINPDLPLMVICLHASRLGPDISDAIREIKSGRPSIAVLIVHHKDFFALPTERSNEILLEKEYREIGAIIDVAFTAGKGMYKCDMNKLAIEEIFKFIKRKGISNKKPQPHAT